MSSPGSTNVDPSDGSTDPTNDGPDGEIVQEGDVDVDEIVDAIQRAEHPELDEIMENEAREIRSRKYLRPPRLDLPGFGEADSDDCAKFVPRAFKFCTNGGRVHEFKHNCMTYDCPHHAPYAVRRRAAGSKSNTGMAPKLKSLISWLYFQRDELEHHYHHLTIDIPDDFITQSGVPLRRLVGIGGHDGVIPEIMKALGIQGVVAYHPYRFENNEPGDNDIGEWQDVLFHETDQDNVDDLDFDPHFHVVGVAPYVDIGVTEEVQNRTGWPIHRIQDEEGYSIQRNPEKFGSDDTDDHAMARALTYCLSHSGIYETEQTRRLAAWLKGPDIDKPDVYDSTKARMAEVVHEAAEETLGISAPDIECDCDYHAHEELDEEIDPGDREIESGAVSMPDLWDRTPDTAKGGTGGDDRDMGVDPNAELPFANRTELPNQRELLPERGNDRSSSSSSSETVEKSPDSDESASEPDDHDDRDDVEKCGAELKHISKAPEYLRDPDWYRQAPYATELEDNLLEYKRSLIERDLDPDDWEPPTVPEADLQDDPPPD